MNYYALLAEPVPPCRQRLGAVPVAADDAAQAMIAFRVMYGGAFYVLGAIPEAEYHRFPVTVPRVRPVFDP